MKTFVTFVVIGSVSATVEEFLTIVVLRRDVPSYLFTLLVLFPTYLSFVYFSSRIIAGSSPVNRLGTSPIS